MHGIDLDGRQAFLRLCHVTGSANVPAIMADGLMPVKDVAQLAERVARDMLAANGRDDLWSEVAQDLIDRPFPYLALLNWRENRDDMIYCHTMRLACQRREHETHNIGHGGEVATAVIRHLCERYGFDEPARQQPAIILFWTPLKIENGTIFAPELVSSPLVGLSGPMFDEQLDDLACFSQELRIEGTIAPDRLTVLRQWPDGMAESPPVSAEARTWILANRDQSPSNSVSA